MESFKHSLFLLFTYISLSFVLGACSGSSSQEEFDENLMAEDNQYADEKNEEDSDVENNEKSVSDVAIEGEEGGLDFISDEKENAVSQVNEFGLEKDLSSQQDAKVANVEVASLDSAGNSADEFRGFSGDAAGHGLPELGSKMPYVVKAGDTLGSISEKIFGTKEYWNEIAELSDLENPNMLYPGEVLYYQLHGKSLAFAEKQLAQEETLQFAVLVEPGDNLSKIAKKYLGSSDRWIELWQANSQIKTPDSLKVGMTLYLTMENVEMAQAKLPKEGLYKKIS